jgi:4-carboxymuconolactone decarboxylase
MTIRRQLSLCAAFLLAASAAQMSFAQSMPMDLDADSHARLPHLQRDNVSEEDLEIFDMLPGRGADGVLGGPLAFAAYNPGAAKALYDLHNAAVAGVLDAHYRELAIMVACRETNYDLEWNGHMKFALDSGVAPEVLETVLNNGSLMGMNEKDALVVSFGRQMLSDKVVDSATFAKGIELFGEQGMMDMVAVMNTYAVSGFYAIAVDEHMETRMKRLPH